MKKSTFLLVLLLKLSFSFSQVNLNLGLMAYYPFNGNANDASGNNNNPSFNSATLTSDRFGTPNTAYHFNGTSSFIQIPNSPTINMGNTMSIAMWVKPTGFYTGACYNNMLMMKGITDIPNAGNYSVRFADAVGGCGPTPNTAQEVFFGDGGALAPTPFVQLNKWYSVIWTYDGTTAKIYIDCVLKASSLSPGITFTNAYDLFLGHVNNAIYPYWLNGDLDEVRLYNRPLNTAEVNTLGGCGPLTDTTINDYTQVLAIDKCKNILTVGDGTKYKTGDTVLLMQMKGAVIDSSNTASFGAITNYKNAGNYEFNYIKSKIGNLIELTNTLTRQYDLPDGKVQLIRVPFYKKLNIPNILTCQPWNGLTGGVLAFNADTVNLNADIDVSGKGFRGTPIDNHVAPCHENQYFYNAASINAGFKGEGIFDLSANNSKGRGKAANAGGGGNGVNAGGGGGANFGSGGLGGKEFLCSAQPQIDNGGVGAAAVSYTNTANKIFLGGAGGTGDENDNSGSAGGNGGGIVLINANYIKSNTNRIVSKGATPASCLGPNCADGQGGGGAGGTAVLNIANFSDNTIVNTAGGDGGSYVNVSPTAYYGPGGGGGGGTLWLKSNSVPANVTIINSGGVNGTWINTSQTGGAAGGNSGGTLFNVAVPVDNVPFKATFDSAKLHVEVKSCTNFKFWGLDDAITAQIIKWQWTTGDGYSDTAQTFTHNYLTPGTYPVKLTATDIYGCVMVYKLDLTVLCRCEAIRIITPNPARDIVTVSGLGCGANSLVLYDMLGQKIADITGDHPSETFDVSKLAKGMYVIRIINNNKVVKNLKVEKM